MFFHCLCSILLRLMKSRRKKVWTFCRILLNIIMHNASKCSTFKLYLQYFICISVFSHCFEFVLIISGVFIIIVIYQVSCQNHKIIGVVRGLFKVTWSSSSGHVQLHQVAQSFSTEYKKLREKTGAMRRNAEKKPCMLHTKLSSWDLNSDQRPINVCSHSLLCTLRTAWVEPLKADWFNLKVAELFSLSFDFTGSKRT